MSEKENKKAITANSAASKATDNYFGTSVLKKLWQTERATNLSRDNQYVFLVDVSANKPSIKEEVQRRYGVKVIAINILRQGGKAKRLGGRLGVRSDSKKAFVTLAAGQKIETT